MSTPPTIPYTETVPSGRRFPIIAQLGILIIILTALFVSHWLIPDDSVATNQLPAASPLVVQTDQHDTTTLPGLADNAITITARAAYVWDVVGQRALYTKNHTDVLPLASITKLMTALIAQELIEAETIITVPLEAIRQPGHNGLSAGERFTQETLTQLALITSSNDAAYTIGTAVGTQLGSAEAMTQFVAAMNIRAEELGFSSLRFFNPTGLDEAADQAGGYGSARDVSFLMEYLVTEYPELLQPTRQEFMRVYNEDGAYHNALNTNSLATNIPNLLGSKTGYTDLAGGNLTIAFDLGYDRPIIITVLGSTRSERFADVTKLYSAVISAARQ